MCVCVYVYMCMCVCAYVYVCMCVCVYVCMCVCVYRGHRVRAVRLQGALPHTEAPLGRPARRVPARPLQGRRLVSGVTKACCGPGRVRRTTGDGTAELMLWEEGCECSA